MRTPTPEERERFHEGAPLPPAMSPQLLIEESKSMQSPGLPAAKTVEQAILLAQLQLLRQMEKTRG